jgi:hypothetical protein
MASVRAGAGVRQNASSGLAQTQGIVELAAGQQTAIRRDLRSVELQLEATVERRPSTAVCASLTPASIRGTRHRPYPADNLSRIDAYGQYQTQAL